MLRVELGWYAHSMQAAEVILLFSTFTTVYFDSTVHDMYGVVTARTSPSLGSGENHI